MTLQVSLPDVSPDCDSKINCNARLWHKPLPKKLQLTETINYKINLALTRDILHTNGPRQESPDTKVLVKLSSTIANLNSRPAIISRKWTCYDLVDKFSQLVPSCCQSLVIGGNP
jgi:hypothetical protein